MRLMNRCIDCSFFPLPPHSYALVPVITFFCLFIIPFWQGTAISADGDTAQGELPASTYSSTPFEYKLENRPDPFVPFISEKAATSSADMDEIVESGEPLTGMQLFEPAQLTLVALIKKGSENMAMVQDSTGKGYVLSEGTLIGRHGIVKNFTPQSVIVEETTMTRAGKKTVNQVVMLLKKEGEK